MSLIGLNQCVDNAVFLSGGSRGEFISLPFLADHILWLVVPLTFPTPAIFGRVFLMSHYSHPENPINNINSIFNFNPFAM